MKLTYNEVDNGCEVIAKRYIGESYIGRIQESKHLERVGRVSLHCHGCLIVWSVHERMTGGEPKQGDERTRQVSVEVVDEIVREPFVRPSRNRAVHIQTLSGRRVVPKGVSAVVGTMSDRPASSFA